MLKPTELFTRLKRKKKAKDEMIEKIIYSGNQHLLETFTTTLFLFYV